MKLTKIIFIIAIFIFTEISAQRSNNHEAGGSRMNGTRLFFVCSIAKLCVFYKQNYDMTGTG